MDFRLPIAIGLGVAYSVWLAWRELKNPACSEERLNTLASYTLFTGAALLFLVIFTNVGYTPIADILAANILSVTSQGIVAFAYACLASGVVFWVASSYAKK